MFDDQQSDRLCQIVLLTCYLIPKVQQRKCSSTTSYAHETCQLLKQDQLTKHVIENP